VGRLYDADEDWRASDEDEELDNLATSEPDGPDGPDGPDRDDEE
jgi:hypothetical protein